MPAPSDGPGTVITSSPSRTVSFRSSSTRTNSASYSATRSNSGSPSYTRSSSSQATASRSVSAMATMTKSGTASRTGTGTPTRRPSPSTQNPSPTDVDSISLPSFIASVETATRSPSGLPSATRSASGSGMPSGSRTRSRSPTATRTPSRSVGCPRWFLRAPDGVASYDLGDFDGDEDLLQTLLQLMLGENNPGVAGWVWACGSASASPSRLPPDVSRSPTWTPRASPSRTPSGSASASGSLSATPSPTASSSLSASQSGSPAGTPASSASVSAPGTRATTPQATRSAPMSTAPIPSRSAAPSASRSSSDSPLPSLSALPSGVLGSGAGARGLALHASGVALQLAARPGLVSYLSVPVDSASVSAVRINLTMLGGGAFTGGTRVNMSPVPPLCQSGIYYNAEPYADGCSFSVFESTLLRRNRGPSDGSGGADGLIVTVAKGAASFPAPGGALWLEVSAEPQDAAEAALELQQVTGGGEDSGFDGSDGSLDNSFSAGLDNRVGSDLLLKPLVPARRLQLQWADAPEQLASLAEPVLLRIAASMVHASPAATAAPGGGVALPTDGTRGRVTPEVTARPPGPVDSESSGDSDRRATETHQMLVFSVVVPVAFVGSAALVALYVLRARRTKSPLRKEASPSAACDADAEEGRAVREAGRVDGGVAASDGGSGVGLVVRNPMLTALRPINLGNDATVAAPPVTGSAPFNHIPSMRAPSARHQRLQRGVSYSAQPTYDDRGERVDFHPLRTQHRHARPGDAVQRSHRGGSIDASDEERRGEASAYGVSVDDDERESSSGDESSHAPLVLYGLSIDAHSVAYPPSPSLTETSSIIAARNPAF